MNNPATFSSEKEYENDIDLGKIIRTLWAGKWIFGAVVVACTVGAIGTGLLVKPVFRADIMLSDAKSDFGKVGGLMGQASNLAGMVGLEVPGLSQSTQIDVAIATLESRRFIESFIVEEKLMPILFEEVWDSEKQAWNVKDKEDIPINWDAFDLFENSILNVFVDPGTSLITLTVNWTDGNLAAEWANAIVQKVNLEMREQAIIESEMTLEYLHRKLETENVAELRLAISNMITKEMQAWMRIERKEQFVFKIIDPAIPPIKPYKPNFILYALLGATLGMVAAVFVVLILQLKLSGSNVD